MSDQDRMSDLSFTKTKRAMSSKHLSRTRTQYKPWWQSVAENNAKKKVVIDRVNGVKVKTVSGYK